MLLLLIRILKCPHAS